VSTPQPAGVHRLHPIRVLLVGSDRRFMRMAAMLLTRNGCTVQWTERPSDALACIKRGRTNVVVMDATSSLLEASRMMAAIETLPVPVGVLMVYEGSEADPIRSLRLLPKWGAFDEIVSEVEYLYDGGQPQAEAFPDALA
jgi:DNA-binding NtrC family response regulator